MAQFLSIILWLLWMAGVESYAQSQALQDSVCLEQKREREKPEPNLMSLKEYRGLSPLDDRQQLPGEKAWLKYDTRIEMKREQRAVFTLTPYTPAMSYDWDPVYLKKIKIGKDTWREPCLQLGTEGILRPALGGGGIGGLDLMRLFERDFWDFKGRKLRARTMKILRLY